MKTKTTVFAPSLAVIWNLIDTAGLNPEPLFRKAQVDPRLMRDPNARVPAVKPDISRYQGISN